ncbi:glycerol kinase [Massilia sp. Root351]|uniref:glycerol kinase GlpK n=1 Tax=Massilia sp. Root351 TaxID=1736522 RepID=UPI00070F50AF|nr:glycerol kinase GlpK [Massilia sp. Root351]KQV91349.1 glycerol kinase [Massilia sp. Root351]
MRRYILALDQGTSSSRAVLFDGACGVVGMAQNAFPQLFPQPGWVEHDPRAIWDSQLSAAREVLAAHGVRAAQLAAIGIANQRETTILWDRATGEPLMNAIVWQDRRTAGDCTRLREAGLQDMVHDKTGLVLDAYFSATKLKWMLDHIPGARQRARRGELAFGTIDSWLVFKLSGAHVTDAGNASRTMLFNIGTLQWDPQLLALFDIPAGVLPDVVASSGVAAHTLPGVFGSAVPIAGIAGDQQAATFGQACHTPGMAKNTIGTGSFMLMNTGTRPAASRHRLLSTIGWTGAGGVTHLMEGSVFMAGATLQWLRDGLGMVDDIAEVERLAATVGDTGGVCLVPAFAGLGAPHWDAYARGAIVGLHRGTTKAHIARAALDGIACQTAEVLRAIEADAGVALCELRVDGGGAASDLLLQLMADALGVPVVRPVNTETTALGAAQLAGLGVGMWDSVSDLAGLWRASRSFEPALCHGERAARMEMWEKAVQRAAGWSYD